jgi:divalent metal cation (Fe/Co/Zn/Cd) transporter
MDSGKLMVFLEKIIMKSNKQYLKIALVLSKITIIYNIIEGIVSTYFGSSDETIALFGFGIDSFVEVISGAGIFHMILRMQKAGIESRDTFEKHALKITGFAFYLLTAGLIIGTILNIIFKIKPDTTIAGIIISGMSIITMWILYSYKKRVGWALDSEAIMADADCTKTCFYLSIILLCSSLLYEIFQIAYIDLIGGVGIAYFAFKEGKEAFEKAESGSLSCSCCKDDCK